MNLGAPRARMLIGPEGPLQVAEQWSSAVLSLRIRCILANLAKPRAGNPGARFAARFAG